MKRVIVLGSTGSIGRSALSVCRALSSRLQVVGLAVNSDVDALLDQAREFGVRELAVADAEAAARCRRAAPQGTRVYGGAQGVAELAGTVDADVVLCAVVGLAGLKPVLAAIEKGTDIALATKEVLVGAGGIVTEAVRRSGVQMLPVDSEHSAMFQCMAGDYDRVASVRRLLLTASGGPFGASPDTDFEVVTREEALAHPRWDMGPKVTIDSATLMNKGLELMEAHWLFGMPLDAIEVVLHPESIVHSMVEYTDGSVMAQLSIPDMRFAIQYALTYPECVDGALPRLDFQALGALHFGAPDSSRFPCLALAREAGRIGGSMPAVLNAANEIAVEAFLADRLRFAGIWRVVESVMARHVVTQEPGLDDVINADAWAREAAQSVCGAE